MKTLKAVADGIQDHLVRQGKGWKLLLTANLLGFAALAPFLAVGSHVGLVAIPLAWGVGYLMAQAKTHNAWVDYLATSEFIYATDKKRPEWFSTRIARYKSKDV